MKYIVGVILLIRLISNINYPCSFDEECPLGYACYDTLCQIISSFTPCTTNGDCAYSCSKNSLCRTLHQLICSNTNQCLYNSQCLGSCCKDFKCSLIANCGGLGEGSACLDSSQCISSCCYNERCDPSSIVTTCSTSRIEDGFRRTIIYLILLGVFNFVLLCVIGILIVILVQRIRWINEYNEQCDNAGIWYPASKIKNFDDSKSSLKNKVDTAPSKTKLSSNYENKKFNYIQKIGKPKGENPLPFRTNQIPEIIINKNNPVNRANVQITNVKSISPFISSQSISELRNDNRNENSTAKYYQDQIQKFSNENKSNIERNRTKNFI